LPPDLAEDLGEWAWFFEALHALWLDSGEYEDFARTALEDFDAPVNQRGYALAQKLNALVPCRYFIFRDVGDGYVPPSTCPKCHGELESMAKRLSCPSCKIVI
jgi:predicted  nucleic acid-binding Zn ribbon protein